ncbi:MAG TPA: TauD/TfdA family dioxygenase [Stellaceae bacterium]|nr:TauD/TfdA family dioxygenase [Stellaceae bacterium]
MPEYFGPAAPIEAPSVWRGHCLRTEDWRVELSSGGLDEIRHIADELRRYPLPAIVRAPTDFDMPECRAAMARVRGILDRGVRFAILDRLPLAEIEAATATAIYWLLAGMVARPVAQKLDGTLIYDVRDTGRAALPGSGVRPDQTNIEIRFHNDNAYNAAPPDYIGLLCLRRALAGGHSRVLSFHTVHNELLARSPAHLNRLYRPFWFDRQREYHAGESPVFAAPVFEVGGEIRARFSAHQINGGYTLKGEPLDEEGSAAVAGLLDLFEEDGVSVDFDLEPGQIQFVHNRALGHSRTAFVDDPDPARRRHLVRLWLRDWGRRAYPG